MVARAVADRPIAADAPRGLEIFPDTAAVSAAGQLSVGGCELAMLAAEYGTPLYVYDEASIRTRARAYRESLKAAYPGRSRVCYAGKAYSAPWLLKLLDEEGLSLDCVSGGELHVARASGFPPDRIFLHGNNKSEDELWLGLEMGVHRIVVDNVEEVERLSRLASERSKTQRVLLRVAPSVEAHTHQHILTGAIDTKFGVSIETGAADATARAIHEAPGLELVGLHAHIGSQIFESEPYEQTIERLFEFAARLREVYGFRFQEFSPGGGFGVRYTLDDPDPQPTQEVARSAAERVCEAAKKHGFEPPELSLEPGRSIIAQAGVAVYRVGSVKHIEGVRTYVAVDGGMADNMRPATYGARYTAVVANRALEQPSQTVAIAGKYCESGDVLIREVELPPVRVGDVIAIPVAGAYQLSMASNYNLSQRPAVVVVKDGKTRLVRRRETYEDLLSAEVL